MKLKAVNIMSTHYLSEETIQKGKMVLPLYNDLCIIVNFQSEII